MKTVLFVCVENSFRSQIAEAYFNKFAPKGWQAISAGSRPAEKVHPNAVLLMREEGIDIGNKKPKALTYEMQTNADAAVIVCGSAECPVVYVKDVEEWGIPDLAKMSIEDARKIRNLIKSKVLEYIEKLKSKSV